MDADFQAVCQALMAQQIANPFELSKASDYTDDQIQDLWVDMPGGGSLVDLLRPASRMSMIVLGGKGSGKTHLMRYCSLPLQERRHRPDLLSGVCEDRYLGLYIRGESLHIARFQEKGRTKEFWQSVFEYYFDLWLAESCVEAVIQVLGPDFDVGSIMERANDAIFKLFTDPPRQRFDAIAGLKAYLRRLRAEIDDDVNNLAFGGEWRSRVKATRGSLVFGIPAIFQELVPQLRDVLFLYLIDEIEMFSVDQQAYLQTLIRFRQGNCSFRLGARLYGIKTYAPYGTEEPNKVGSEFDQIELDRLLRDDPRYADFARVLCARRLLTARVDGATDPESERILSNALDAYFEVDQSLDPLKAVDPKSFPPVERRQYFLKLRKQLSDYRGHVAPLGVKDSAAAEEIVHKLSVPSYPLLEKLNLLLFYQAWYEKQQLILAADSIAEESAKYVGGEPNTSYSEKLSHFKSDLLAQLRSEVFGERPLYAGFDTFVRMSQGIPRNLIVILKNIFQWAAFNDERPFSGGQISLASQRKGVSDSSEWFWEDAQPGTGGTEIRNAIARLARLFREVRFSDKPAECALVAFSVDWASLSEPARQTVLGCLNWSYLTQISGGALYKNSKRVDAKFQLSPMLAPRWTLSTSRRGTIPLSSRLAEAVFNDAVTGSFEALMRERISEMNAPFAKLRTSAELF